MTYYYLIPVNQHERIKQLYKDGLSAQEIIDMLKLSVSARSLQRFIAKHGLSRTTRDAYHNAMKRGRIKWVKKQSSLKTHRTKIRPSLRYKILERDGFRCVKCGATAKDRLLEVDHVDSNPANHRESNLQTLCELCNIGKFSPNRIKKP